MGFGLGLADEHVEKGDVECKMLDYFDLVLVHGVSFQDRPLPLPSSPSVLSCLSLMCPRNVPESGSHPHIQRVVYPGCGDA